MTRIKSMARRFALVQAAAVLLLFPARTLQAQQAAPATAAQSADGNPADAKGAAKPTPTDEMDAFTPKPAPPLPAGMTGSDTKDRRYTLKAGMYDAGEAAMGMKHVSFVKKPGPFRLDATSPDDPQVDKTLALLGVADKSKMPKLLKPVIAQLAYANSDFAFQGTHLFQGNFYGVSIYDIADPARTKLLTTVICPGGQGDVSVYGKLLFMSVEMPNGRLDCGAQGFPPALGMDWPDRLWPDLRHTDPRQFLGRAGDGADRGTGRSGLAMVLRLGWRRGASYGASRCKWGAVVITHPLAAGDDL